MFENKRKQLRSWTEMCECYDMIYADAHEWYGQSQSWSLSFRPEESD